MNQTPKKLLATGHGGFVGSVLQAWLQARPDCGVHWCAPGPEFDVLDAQALRAVIAREQPDWILHLAAQSHVPTAWQDPVRTLQVNAGGTANLLQVLAETGFRGRLLYVSSADVYGAVPEDELPVAEDRLPAPRNPYASSKVAAEVLCRQWAITRGLDVVIVRPFNHTGAGQRPDFALPSFAREVAAIKLGRQEPRIQVGDLAVTRDFLDVRDVVAAYLALLAKGVQGETYNVCSGREVLLSDALAQLLDIAGIRAEVATDPARMRPAEQRRMCGTHAKLTGATGWRPQIPLRETLAGLLEHWIQEQGT